MPLTPQLKPWLHGALACATLIGCAAMTQQSPNATPSGSSGGFSSNASSVPPSAMPGGRTTQAVDSQNIKDVAAEAIRLLRDRAKDPTLSLLRIRSAQTQVVAGANFYLEMDVTTANGPRTVKVVVYRDLNDMYSLSDVQGL